MQLFIFEPEPVHDKCEEIKSTTKYASENVPNFTWASNDLVKTSPSTAFVGNNISETICA
jgi:hypothetical protein